MGLVEALLTDARVWLGLVVTILDGLIIVLLVPRILLDERRRETGATLAWLFFIVLVPFLGLLAFWLFGTTRLRLRRRKRRKVEAEIAPRLGPLLPGEGPAPPIDEQLLHLTRRLDVADPVAGNAVTLYREGPATFDALEAAIDEAREHVHLVYYIWQADRTGERLRDALVRAARRGVEVRLLLDDVGSRPARGRFFRPLREAGGRVARFLPVLSRFLRVTLNNRNHRKIVVVDGATGFTGGMNVGDEYAGIGDPWRDAHVRIVGPAVNRLQEVFAEDWFHAAGEDLARQSYFPNVEPSGDAWAQILASGPDDDRWHGIHTLLFSAVNLARQRVWIETPYFVPDVSMALALQAAALRGIDVRLLVPAESDNPLVLYAGRSFYGELLAAGVKIYELPKAMLHAKTATIDDRIATVGSANMDQRSFRLNFEANAFFFGPEVAAELARSFEVVQAASERLDADAFARRPRRQRLAEALTRLLAPLL